MLGGVAGYASCNDTLGRRATGAGESLRATGLWRRPQDQQPESRVTQLFRLGAASHLFFNPTTVALISPD